MEPTLSRSLYEGDALPVEPPEPTPSRYARWIALAVFAVAGAAAIVSGTTTEPPVASLPR